MPENRPKKRRRVLRQVHLDRRGYALNSDLLKQFDVTFRNAAIFVDDNGNPMAVTARYWAILSNGTDKKFDSVESVVQYPNTTVEHITELRADFRDTTRKRGISMWFEGNGAIRLSVSAAKVLREHTIESCKLHLRAAHPDYSWFARKLVIEWYFRALCAGIIAFLSIALAMFVAVYTYGRIKGIDLDPKVIPQRQKEKIIADALKSTDVNEKLNALLSKELAGFANISDLLPRIQRGIAVLLVSIIVLSIVYGISRHLRSYYPMASFAIGQQAQVLSRVERKRDLWVTGIIIGFIVNIAAGVFVALFG